MDLPHNIPSAENCGINMKNESSLHSSIKKWYYKPGDRLEVKVDNFFADIVRDDVIIEIQTKNFGAIRKKLYMLLENYKVKLVYPIPVEKYIIKLSPSSSVVSRRRSPKKGSIIDVFDELVSMPDIINHENFSLEILMIVEESIFCKDGKGSWRRNGDSIVDRKLLDVTSSRVFEKKEDFAAFLPENLSTPFTNRLLSQTAHYPLHKVRKLTYCLKKMGLIKEVGKKGNALLFDVL